MADANEMVWGLDRIEALRNGVGEPIKAGEKDWFAVGCIQDLLAGFQADLPKRKRVNLPEMKDPGYGNFDWSAGFTVRTFQERQPSLKIADPKHPQVDQVTLRRMLEASPVDPRISWCYAKLLLKKGQEISVFERYVIFVSLFEVDGFFTSVNTGGSDKQGLSYGIIQWAQGQSRLSDIVNAMIAADRRTVEDQLKKLLPKSADPIQELQDYLAKPRNGLDEAGHCTDSKFNFVETNWKDDFFKRLALNAKFQAVQLRVAGETFARDWAIIHAACPEIKSDRQVAFMMDLANQHGVGKPGEKKGAIRIYEKAMKAPGPHDLLIKMRDISVAAIAKSPRFGGVSSRTVRSAKTRREWYIDDHHFLSDDPFEEAGPVPLPQRHPAPSSAEPPYPKSLRQPVSEIRETEVD